VKASSLSQSHDFLAPRTCLLAPLPEHEQAADLLAGAADAILAGDLGSARERLRQADMPMLFDYARRLMGREDHEVHRRRALDMLPIKTEKVLARMPGATETMALHARDGWRCRFCGCRVVSSRARSTIRACLPDALSWGESDGYHGAFFAMTASVDHVVPHSAGGGNEPENLVTACWSCQFGRGAYTIQELGLLDPRDRPPIVDGWDGLTRVIGKTTAALARRADEDAALSPFNISPPNLQRDHDKKTPTPGIYSTAQADWLRNLDTIEAPPSHRLIEFLEGCADVGVSWSLNKVLLARMRVGGTTVEFLAVEPDGRVHVPWSLGGRKDEFRGFAEILAAGIGGAVAYETPKLWNVALAGKKPLGLLRLLDSTKVLRSALEALHHALQPVD
jgi:hypothetical protein